jgi:hypothetical protein
LQLTFRISICFDRRGKLVELDGLFRGLDGRVADCHYFVVGIGLEFREMGAGGPSGFGQSDETYTGGCHVASIFLSCCEEEWKFSRSRFEVYNLGRPLEVLIQQVVGSVPRITSLLANQYATHYTLAS